MKKVIGLLVALCVMFGVATNTSVTVNAETYDVFTYEVNDGKVTITECDRYASGKIVIPSTIDGYPVTSIGNRAFVWRGEITGVTIPKGVVSIGEEAFSYCYKLEDISIPETVTSIGSGAFAQCSLKSVKLPGNLTVISEGLFNVCPLESIEIPAKVKSIGGGAFRECSLTSITIPKSVTVIGNEAFDACSSLRYVYIPETVRSIGEYAFGYDVQYDTRYSSFPIVGKKGSAAEKYAKKNKFTFLSFTPKTNLSSVTKYKGAFKVKWKKNTTATGYQIRYSLNKNMSGAKTVTISKNKTTSKKITKLKKKTKYYVQLRPYKTVFGSKIYGDWSSVKTVKTK